MEKINLKNKIYISYSEETDMTTIFEDIFSDSEKLKSTEVKGFYFGKPTEVVLRKIESRVLINYMLNVCKQ